MHMRKMDVLRLDVTPWEVTDALMRERQQERIRGEREDLLIFVVSQERVGRSEGKN